MKKSFSFLIGAIAIIGATTAQAQTMNCNLDRQYFEGNYPQSFSVNIAKFAGTVNIQGIKVGYVLSPEENGVPSSGATGMAQANYVDGIPSVTYRCSL